MLSTLGIYVEDNLIKYAKVSKNNEVLKVESFGIKFYDKLEETIKQIVEETYSYKTPISINLAEEQYNYYDVFGLLNKKDIDGIVKTSFENACYDKGVNKDSYEQRYIYTNSPDSKEKIRAIHISSPKTSVAKRKNQFSGLKVSNIAPIGSSITNIINEKQDCIIVNIEANTTITQVKENTIKDIKVLSYGAKEVFEKINSKENSYSKAYEICKNSTIYTNEGQDLQYEENEYLEDIMPTLYNIATELKEIVSAKLEAIEKIYITGSLSVVNNIDIYFQEFFKNIKCEILKPYFITNNTKINVKDYIEVNSAISLAVQDLENKVKNTNFLRETGAGKILLALKSDIRLPRINEMDFSNIYGKHQSLFNVASFTIVFFLISYITVAMVVNSLLVIKDKETDSAILEINTQIREVENYNRDLSNRITKYKSLITSIENDNEKISEDKRYKDLIPNLMNNIMAVIPKNVQLTSIENTNGTHIVIEARSARYEQLAFFKTKIKTEEILLNVISDTGVASGDSIKVTIEGELP